MPRTHRSPNYPQLSLEAALQRVKKVYEVENSHKADKEVIAKVLGYSSLNGTSLGLLGTLNRYGLLEADGDGLKVSRDAVDILVLPEGEPEKVEALHRCAFAPRVFADLSEHFGVPLPSDANLRHHLVTKQSFLQKAADEVIRIYRENLEFIKTQSGEYSRNNSTNGQQQPSEATMRTPAPQANNPISATYNGRVSPSHELASNSFGARDNYESADLKVRIGEDAKAIIKFEGVVTKEGIESLIQLLELQKEHFPSKEMATKTKEKEMATKTEEQATKAEPQQKTPIEQKSLFEHVMDDLWTHQQKEAA